MTTTQVPFVLTLPELSALSWPAFAALAPRTSTSTEPTLEDRAHLLELGTLTLVERGVVVRSPEGRAEYEPEHRLVIGLLRAAELRSTVAVTNGVDRLAAFAVLVRDEYVVVVQDLGEEVTAVAITDVAGVLAVLASSMTVPDSSPPPTVLVEAADRSPRAALRPDGERMNLEVRRSDADRWQSTATDLHTAMDELVDLMVEGS